MKWIEKYVKFDHQIAKWIDFDDALTAMIIVKGRIE